MLDVVPMASLNQSPRDAASDEKGLLPEDTWLRTQAKRKARIRQVCSEDNIDGDLLGKPQSRSILKQLKVDDKHKVILLLCAQSGLHELEKHVRETLWRRRSRSP